METPTPNTSKSEWKPNVGFKLAMTVLAPFVSMFTQIIDRKSVV